jgi:hypothetical protein
MDRKKWSHGDKETWRHSVHCDEEIFTALTTSLTERGCLLYFFLSFSALYVGGSIQAAMAA